MNYSNTLPPEWTEQDGVLIAWPHAGTDWKDMLSEVIPYYQALAHAISTRESLVVLCQSIEELRPLLSHCDTSRITFVEYTTHDTWTRDYGPITVTDQGAKKLYDYRFNAWGGKFESARDDKATNALFAAGVFDSSVQYIQREDFVLEGGSIESNGNGCLLTTSSCLLSPQRNPSLTQAQIETVLRKDLNIKKILWLKHGQLSGDDTDGHIDTLARFCNAQTIAYVQCKNTEDEHYESLQQMEDALQNFTDCDDNPFHLVPLPMVAPIRDAAGNRLPATYANFLIINGAILLPTYNSPTDAVAKEIVQSIFPDREVVGIDCRTLIKQGGSLHCSTMQFPKGVLCQKITQ